MKLFHSLNHRFVTWVSWHPERVRGVIYLTFDDGPEDGITEFVLDRLAERDQKATFFCVGSQVDRRPDLFSRMVQEGHAVGNHTFSHCSGWELPTGEFVDDVEQCRKRVDSTLFRPPWGMLRLGSYLRLRRRYRIVLWDRNSGDTDAEVDYHQVDKVLSSLRDGDTVLFHFGNKHGWKTRLILPYFLDGLRERGFISRPIR